MMENLPYKEVKEKIDAAEAITLLSHINPDADTLGSSLGIYALLERYLSKKIEVVNASAVLPLYLDFLPNFKKIKHKMEYSNSLIIACDCGSIDRLGFTLEGRDIINIDHHLSNTKYGSINVILPQYASASQVAFALFKDIYSVEADAATCFYAALLSDTRYFTASSVNKEVFHVAKSLLALGAKADKIAYHFTQRRSLASLRILQRALTSLSFFNNATIATLCITASDIKASGATVVDMEGIVDYAKSLVTVEIAIFAIETDQGIRISLRSKRVNISQVALAFGGGGHKLAAGFTFKQGGVQESIDTILGKIEDLDLLLDGKITQN